MYSFWFRVILGGVHHKLYPGKSENGKFTLQSGMFAWGVYHQFYLGKTDFSLYLSLVSVCLYICTGISLYILISWPFRMGSHWWHWTAKSWLSALAVLNGGRRIFSYIFLLVDHFKWALIGNIGQWRVDSVLWQFQMGGGGYFLIYSY